MSTPADYGSTGSRMHQLAAELYPICRSITGDGLRRTLAILADRIPLAIHEVPTGTRAFDWTVPKEWNIRDAWIKDSRGNKVVDFRECNLHVLNYSAPVHRVMPAEELRRHIHTLTDHPDWIPYKTSYYEESWGFCLRHRDFLNLTGDSYEVCIDSSLEDGSLTYGECILPGQIPGEILVSSHVCHPALANDNLSGVVVATFLAQHLARSSRRHSYRFIFAPGTIGAVVWLSRNQDVATRIKHGLILTCIGDSGGFSYKRSRRGTAEVDQAMGHVLKRSGQPYQILDFSPYGYDERQYCSPGFNLPVGCLMRTPWGQFPEYHTSADNLDFIRPASLEGSFQLCLALTEVLENNLTYRNLNPLCEPQLSRRGIPFSPGPDAASFNLARLWVLNLSDGSHSLLDIADRSGLSMTLLRDAARQLTDYGLLAEEGDRGV